VFELEATPRAVDKCPTNPKVVVGLRNGDIHVIQPSTGATKVMESHCDGEVWGLDICT
jgi:hypothetical protein